MEIYKFFHAGGPISPKADCFVVRKCEQSVLEAILAPSQQRQYVSVLGSRQVGKTSLLASVKTILDKRKIPSAFIDLSPFQRQDSAAWYNQVAFRLHEQFKEVDSYENGVAHDSLSFISFLDRLEVVAGPKKWAVIMFDEIASVPLEITNDFFPSLRRLYTSRLFETEATPATRFIFLFAGSFYPGALVTNRDNSPFNVSKEVEVLDFERFEMEQLLEKGAKMLHLHFESKAIDEIWNATKGHPFLTQKISQDIVHGARQIVTSIDVKRVIDRFVYTSNDTHLRSIVGYLKDNPKYTQLLHEIVVGQKNVSMHRVENTSVERIGVLVGNQKDGSARIRNKIYERYLYTYLTDSSWLSEVIFSKQRSLNQEKSLSKMPKAIEVFYSFDQQDEALQNLLEKHLSSLRQENLIINWHVRKILPGQEWKGEINTHLNTAQIILLLVSPDFLASGYCFDIEVRQVMKRYENGEALVIPIILRPVDWRGTPFGKLQALPTEAKPVTLWTNQDEAFFDIAKGIRGVIQKMNLLE